MHFPARLVAALTLPALLPALAGDFDSVTPADHLVYLELRELPAISEHVNASPLGKAYRDFDWKSAALQLFRLSQLDPEMAEAGAPDISEEELTRVLDRVERGWSTLSDHMNGDWVMTLGNFEDTMDVFSANQDIREQLLPDDLTLEGEEMEEE